MGTLGLSSTTYVKGDNEVEMKVRWGSMERRVGRREEERIVGQDACGLHRRPNGRWRRPLIVEPLCHTCLGLVWCSVEKRETILSRPHLKFCVRLMRRLYRTRGPYAILQC